jgi:uncharacterized membrane protein
MTKDEKLALLEDLFRQEDDRQSMVYARMYGMLAAWVRDEDLNQMLQFRGVNLDNLTETL